MSSTISVNIEFPCQYDDKANIQISREHGEMLNSDYGKRNQQKIESHMVIDQNISNDEAFVSKMKSLMIHKFKCLEWAKELDYKIRILFKDKQIIKEATAKRTDCIKYSVKDHLKILHMATLRNKHTKDGALTMVNQYGIYLRDSDPVIQSLSDIDEIQVQKPTDSKSSKKSDDPENIIKKTEGKTSDDSENIIRKTEEKTEDKCQGVQEKEASEKSNKQTDGSTLTKPHENMTPKSESERGEESAEHSSGKTLDNNQNNICYEMPKSADHVTVDSEVCFNLKHENRSNDGALQLRGHSTDYESADTEYSPRQQTKHRASSQHKINICRSGKMDNASDDSNITQDPFKKVNSWLLGQPIENPVETNPTRSFFQRLLLLSQDELRWIFMKDEEIEDFKQKLSHYSVSDLTSLLKALEEVTACKVILAYHNFVEVTYPQLWNSKDYTMLMTDMINSCCKSTRSTDMSIHGECISMIRYKSELSFRDGKLECYKKKICEYEAANAKLLAQYKEIKDDLLTREENYVKETLLAENKVADLRKQIKQLKTEAERNKSTETEAKSNHSSSKLSSGISKTTSSRKEISRLNLEINNMQKREIGRLTEGLDIQSREKTREIESLKAEIVTWKESSVSNEKTIASLKKRLKESDQRKGELSNAIQQLETEKSYMILNHGQECDKLNKEKDKLGREIEIIQSNSKKQIVKADGKIEELSKLLKEFEARKVDMTQSHSQKCDELNREKEKLGCEIETLKSTSKTQLIVAQERIDELLNSVRQLETEKSGMIWSHMQKCDEMNRENDKLRQEIQSLSTEKEMLRRQETSTNDEDAASVRKGKPRRKRGSKNSKNSNNSSDKKKSVQETIPKTNNHLMTTQSKNHQVPSTNVTNQSKNSLSNNPSFNPNTPPFYPVQTMGSLNQYQQWIHPIPQTQNQTHMHNIQPTPLNTESSNDCITRRLTECNLDDNNNDSYKQKPLTLTDDYTQSGKLSRVYDKEILGRPSVESNRAIKSEEDMVNKRFDNFQVTSYISGHNANDDLDTDINERLLKGLTFNGSNWAAFIKTFDDINERAGWSDEQAALRFRFALRDKALELWGKLDDPILRSYSMVRAQFQKIFGIRDNPSIVRRELMRLKQEEKESIDDFYLKVSLMISQAYPSSIFPQTTVDEIAYDTFLFGLRDNHIAAIVRFTTKTKNLTTAYESAREHLVFQQTKAKVDSCQPTANIRADEVRLGISANIAKAEYVNSSSDKYNYEGQVSPRDAGRQNDYQEQRPVTQGENTVHFRRENRRDEPPRNMDRQDQYSRPRSESGNSGYSSGYGHYRGGTRSKYHRGQCFDCGSRQHYKGSKYCTAYDQFYSGSPESGRTYDSLWYNRRRMNDRRRNIRRNDSDRRCECESECHFMNMCKNSEKYRRDDGQAHRRQRSDNPNWRNRNEGHEAYRGRHDRARIEADRHSRARSCSMCSRAHDFSEYDFSD